MSRQDLSPFQWELLRMLTLSSNANLLTPGSKPDGDVLALLRCGFLQPSAAGREPRTRLMVWQVTESGRAAFDRL